MSRIVVCKKCGKNKRHHGRGYCGNCYMEEKNKGAFTNKICSIYGCGKPFYSKGLCKRHWQQIRTNGEIVGDPSRSYRDENDFISNGDTARIILFNCRGEKVGEAIIDTENVERCRKHQWHLTPRGYAESRIKGKLVKLHQFVFGNKNLDHKNRDKLDNRLENLRECCQVQNLANTQSRGGSSKYKGVWKPSGEKFWCCAITYNKERTWLGVFKDEDEAALAYNKKAKELAGEFAFLNEI